MFQFFFNVRVGILATLCLCFIVLTTVDATEATAKGVRHAPQGNSHSGIEKTDGWSETSTVYRRKALILDQNSAEALEEKLLEDADNLEIRKTLLFCYALRRMPLDQILPSMVKIAPNSTTAEKIKKLLPELDWDVEKALERFAVHMRWFVRNDPGSEIVGIIQPWKTVDGEELTEEIAHQWLAQVDAHEDDLAVLWNAARFFGRTDREQARILLAKGADSDQGNPRWQYDLGWSYYLVGLTKVRERANAKKALLHFEKALAIADDDYVRNHWFLYDYMSRSAYRAGKPKKAMRYAERMLRESEEKEKEASRRCEWSHGPHTVIGCMALDRGDVEGARNALLASGRVTNCHPIRWQIGPSMALAKRMLEQGEKESVLEYLDLLKEGWKQHEYDFETWAGEIREGKSPSFRNTRLW